MSIGLRSRVGGACAVLVVLAVIAACGSTGELPPESTATTDGGTRRFDSGSGIGEVPDDGSSGNQDVDAGKKRPKIDSGTGEVGPCVPIPATAACLNHCGNVDDGCGGTYPCGDTCTHTAGSLQLCDSRSNVCVTPRSTCPEYGAECGTIKDDCGQQLPCGTCPDDVFGNHRECDQATYKCIACPAHLGAEFCTEIGFQCGKVSRCNFEIDCGTCKAGVEACDAVSHVCKPIAPASCEGKCGPISSGDGGIIQCGGCPSGQECGVGGIESVCTPTKPSECAALGYECTPSGPTGLTSQCGGKLDCGSCPVGQVCRSNATCGPPCQPKACGELDAACGRISDGCGQLQNCGGCADGVCNPNTNQCCTPKTCADYPGACGVRDNGCGGSITCNPCGGGQTCLANGGCCSRKTCGDLPGQCGNVSDQCGGVVSCGCADGKSCVGGQCQTCTPRTCDANYAGQCGTFTNGCGGSITCECTGNKKCGGGGVAGFCGCANTTTCPPGFVGPYETCTGTLFCSQ